MNKLRTALSLTKLDWLTLIQAWFLLFFIDLGLRCLPFQRLQDIISGKGTREAETSGEEQRAIIQQVRRWVDYASRHHLYPMTCLRRALTLKGLLARRGIYVDLRFGANKEAGQVVAHAWLEHNGVPIGEPEMVKERFMPLNPLT